MPYDVETIIIPILLQIKIFDSLSSILKSRSSENCGLLGLTQLEKIDLTFIWQQNLYLPHFLLELTCLKGKYWCPQA